MFENLRDLSMGVFFSYLQRFQNGGLLKIQEEKKLKKFLTLLFFIARIQFLLF